MKFIFADSLDYVDPKYDFVTDRSPTSREPYWDDVYPHEALGYSPYDGILVSRAIVGGYQGAGKYSESQAMRFRRVGAREFLRFREKDFPGTLMFGDCGAFSYHKLEHPPYSADEMIDFYGDGQFTHGCSIDHVIFDFFENSDDASIATPQLEENRRRFEITSENAAEFLEKAKRIGSNFTPLGVVQGWSPQSMAESALRLKKMGYTYIAIGGMVPLRAPQIKTAMEAIRKSVGDEIRIHILGFAKADEIASFSHLNITSFDTTSPLIRAFKDANRNYYSLKSEGGIEYYSAIRIPQAIENNGLKSLAKQGVYSQEDLQHREMRALGKLRAFDRGEIEVDEVLEAVMAYTAPLAIGRDHGHTPSEVRKLESLRDRYHRTLTDRPWKSCSCNICSDVGVEVIIFRASNRNKRRGIHNLQTFRKHVRRTEKAGNDVEKV